MHIYLFHLLIELSRRQLTLRPDMDQCTVHSAELNHLQKIIHFPEEVALLLTRTEYALFNSVSPSYYIRQVTLDLSRSPMANHHPNVQDLIQRFNEVNRVFNYDDCLIDYSIRVPFRHRRSCSTRCDVYESDSCLESIAVIASFMIEWL